MTTGPTDTAVLDRVATGDAIFVDRPASLRDVIAAIPETCYERSTARGLWLAARDIVMHAIVVFALYEVHAWWAVVLLWLASGFTTSAMFVLGHDAAHEALFDSKRLNAVVGRILFLPTLHIYSAWKLGHNHIHHRHTAREQMDFVWHPVTPQQYAAFGPLAKLRHRLEWSAAGAGFYYLTRIWWSKMIVLRPPKRFKRDIDKDRALLAVLFIGFAFGAAVLGGVLHGDFLGAAWMITKLIGMPFVAFCWFIGFTVYVHHINVRMLWTRRRDWNKVDAQMSTTSVLRVRKPLGVFFHSIYTHVPHHVDVRIPCYHLDDAQAAIEAAYPQLVLDEKLTLRGYLSTTRDCKLFDFDDRRWYDYRAGRTAIDRAARDNTARDNTARDNTARDHTALGDPATESSTFEE
jgi:acyl-lipid omega-6 desaturase (Delta-12 desaturase)